jgi:hypothetical protein
MAATQQYVTTRTSQLRRLPFGIIHTHDVMPTQQDHSSHGTSHRSGRDSSGVQLHRLGSSSPPPITTSFCRVFNPWIAPTPQVVLLGIVVPSVALYSVSVCPAEYNNSVCRSRPALFSCRRLLQWHRSNARSNRACCWFLMCESCAQCTTEKPMLTEKTIIQ